MGKTARADGFHPASHSKSLGDGLAPAFGEYKIRRLIAHIPRFDVGLVVQITFNREL
jgi:hypothetical protein